MKVMAVNGVKSLDVNNVLLIIKHVHSAMMGEA